MEKRIYHERWDIAPSSSLHYLRKLPIGLFLKAPTTCFKQCRLSNKPFNQPYFTNLPTTYYLPLRNITVFFRTRWHSSLSSLGHSSNTMAALLVGKAVVVSDADGMCFHKTWSYPALFNWKSLISWMFLSHTYTYETCHIIGITSAGDPNSTSSQCNTMQLGDYRSRQGRAIHSQEDIDVAY